MILVDLNQVLVSNVMQHMNIVGKDDMQEDMIRHIVLNSIRSYNKQFKTKYGDLVICCDSKKYWRREVFPFYKAHRKKDREKSDINWTFIFDVFNKIRDELKENFPYRVIEVEGAEADDIIAVLAARFSPTESILILSSDKDFVQLQKYKNVTQYSPILKRFISTDDPHLYIKEHILKGDRGDGIPNFLSPDNVFVLGERQKTINSKKLSAWINSDPTEFCTSDIMMRGYQRNQLLIDLEYTPQDIKSKIVETFDNYKPNTKTKMLNFFMQKRLKALLEISDEFQEKSMKNLYEVFAEFENAPTKADKINVLRQNGGWALRNVLKGTYDPNIQFIFEQVPYYQPSDAPPGLGYSSIHKELDRAYIFETNNPKVDPNLSFKRKEQILIQILELLEAKESEIFMNMLLKKQKVKGLTRAIVKEAFPDLLS